MPLASRPLSTAPLKKEPEDIFAGLDTASEPVTSGGMEMESEPRRSPLKFILIAILVILLVAAAGGAVWYFFIREKPVVVQTQTPTTTTPTIVTTQPEPVVETPPVQPADQTPPPNLPPPQSITTTTEPVPTPVALIESADTDGDGLSDPEEASIGTDATMQDSDGDGFSDSAELLSGYDPLAARVALSASTHFRFATIGTTLQVYLPAAWTVVADTTSPGDELIQTGTPTAFSVRVSSLAPSASFQDWFAANQPTKDVSTLRSFTTKAGYHAYMSQDRLDSYIEIPGSIVTITYHPNTSSSYDFRGMYDIVVETIRSR